MFRCEALIKKVQEQHAVLPILLFEQYEIRGAGHQADGTSSRIVKLGTSSRIVPYKLVKYD